jgi:hypothetical protein
MAGELRAFQDAILVRNVVARVADAEHESREFATPDALKSYLHEHPGADKSKHHVKRPGVEKDWIDIQNEGKGGHTYNRHDREPGESDDEFKEKNRVLDEEHKKLRDQWDAAPPTDDQGQQDDQDQDPKKPSWFGDKLDKMNHWLDKLAVEAPVAMEFATPEAMAKYLHDHPGADPEMHHVREKSEEERSSEESEAHRPVRRDPTPPRPAPPPGMLQAPARAPSKGGPSNKPMTPAEMAEMNEALKGRGVSDHDRAHMFLAAKVAARFR